MKRFTLFVVLICTVALSFGQVLKKAPNSLVQREAPNDQTVYQNHTKGAGDIIWQTTFNWKDTTQARGWKLPAGWRVKDITALGNEWVWREKAIEAIYTHITAPPDWFVSKTDGFICLPMDEYNSRDGVSTDNGSDSYIETELIDCSAAASAVVKFNQYFRYCCSTPYLEMTVTTDDVHWSSIFECSFGVPINSFTTARFRSVEFNISELAAGSSTLRIRFYMHGDSHYFWMIDDLKVVESYQNNLILEDYWADANVDGETGIGTVSYWPLSQIGMADPKGGKIGSYKLKGAILNGGIENQYNQKLNFQVLRNGQEILNQNSVTKALMSNERDTLSIPAPFLATDYGDYSFNFTAVGDVADEVPANNVAKINFTVNDTLYHRPDFTTESSEGSGGWVDGNYSGDMAGTAYDISAPCEITSIYARLRTLTDSVKIPTQFQFVLVKAMGNSVYNEVITSEIMDFKPNMENTWQILEMVKDGESEFLTPGLYAAMVRMMGDNGSDLGVNGMRIGVDTDTKFSSGYALFYRVKVDNWIEPSVLSQVGMILKESGGPTQAPVTFNVDMTKHIANGSFKPGTDVITVKGLAPSWNGTATMTDPDGNGIFTATVAGLPVSKVLNYKYSINGTAEAYPLTGDPYRKWTVRYWNVINDTYNGGVTTGVDPVSLVASFSVYPNPTQGAFNVAITSTVPSDLVITLTNIQGQVIYQNTVAKAINHQECIDQKLSKGLYFLSINNGKEVMVQKVIVQ